jgi:hypothetical protein
MRGQLSIEFLVVISGLLIIVAVVTMPLYNQARADADRVTRLADAREAVNTIVNALNTVYAGGVGARQTVEYRLPNGVLSISFVDGEENRVDVRIKLNLRTDNVVRVGTILPSRGDKHRVIVDNENFKVASGLHRMTFTYKFSDNLRHIKIRGA